MIFLTLIAIGALTGAALRWSRGQRVGGAAQLGAAGAFLFGGLAAGIARYSPGPLDPVVLAIGVLGAILLVLLPGLESRGHAGGHRHD